MIITQFEAGLAVGTIIGLTLSYVFLLIGSIVEEKYKIREKKIQENVMKFIQDKEGGQNRRTKNKNDGSHRRNKQ